MLKHKCIMLPQNMYKSLLEVSSLHEKIILDFLKFSRVQRTQSIKAVEASIIELADSRLLEDTFTSDEVREILEGVCSLVKVDVSNDLIHGAHTAALLLQQMFKQADKWHLQLQIDLTQLETREWMQKMADFEHQMETGSGLPSLSRHLQVAPLNTAGGDHLLQSVIESLKEENGQLRQRLQVLEEKATCALSAKDALQDDLKMLQVRDSKEESASLQSSDDFKTTDSQNKQRIAELEQALQHAWDSQGDSETAQLQRELDRTSLQLVTVTEELSEARKDLENEFGSSSQYTNMKIMLASKNKLIKELRSKLLEYKETSGSTTS